MKSFKEHIREFAEHFAVRHFPAHTPSLYDPAQYILDGEGKRIRPVLCLMGNDLFDEIKPDTYHVATAIELFHNFTLIHDDIMDKAPLRRGRSTVHSLYGESTAILAGDVMMVAAYQSLNKIQSDYAQKILKIFNQTALEVCEGQQIDMDFEKRESVGLDEYISMIQRKTSVLLAASLQMGALLGGAGERNQQHIYEFGRNLGIAFQIQDDYLDAFGDPLKTGKQVGGDIIANKKTFLTIHVLEAAEEKWRLQLQSLMQYSGEDKVNQVLDIYRDCGVDQWAIQLKQHYQDKALFHLDEIAVLYDRKRPLQELANYLLQREY